MAGSDISLNLDKKAMLRLGDQIDVLTMGPVRRRKLLRKIGKQTRTNVRKNVRNQTTVTGQAMDPRADRKKRKMFRKMAKGMVVRLPNDHAAVITWKNAGQAKTAYRHHHGVPEDFTASRAAKVYGVPNYQKPATPAQAKALNQEGYKRPVARKRGKGGAILKKMSQKWIRENMSQGQAGLILRLMRTNSTRGKQRWTIQVPERPILGATPQQANTYLTAMATDALKEIRTQ